MVSQRLHEQACYVVYMLIHQYRINILKNELQLSHPTSHLIKDLLELFLYSFRIQKKNE